MEKIKGKEGEFWCKFANVGKLMSRHCTVYYYKDRELLFNYINDNTSLGTVSPYRARLVGKGSVSI